MTPAERQRVKQLVHTAAKARSKRVELVERYLFKTKNGVDILDRKPPPTLDRVGR